MHHNVGLCQYPEAWKLQKMKKLALLAGMVALFNVISMGQNNCASAPPTGTCAAPEPPAQIWCAGNNIASTCPGGKSWLGVNTTDPAGGSWSGQLEGLDAATILGAGLTPGPQSDPNGGVGPTNASGVGQYLEFSDNYLQAFDRATGSPIFSPKANGVAAPQGIAVLFEPGGSPYCKNPSLDGIATYDRIDSVFVVTGYDPQIASSRITSSMRRRSQKPTAKTNAPAPLGNVRGLVRTRRDRWSAQ